MSAFPLLKQGAAIANKSIGVLPLPLVLGSPYTEEPPGLLKTLDSSTSALSAQAGVALPTIGEHLSSGASSAQAGTAHSFVVSQAILNDGCNFGTVAKQPIRH